MYVNCKHGDIVGICDFKKKYFIKIFYVANVHNMNLWCARALLCNILYTAVCFNVPENVTSDTGCTGFLYTAYRLAELQLYS